MLNLVAAIGGGLFVLASLLVGGRLLWAGIRQRSLTEFALGSGLFFSGGVGYPLLSAAQMAPDLSEGARTAVALLSMLMSAGGLAAVNVFTRRAFRPHELWSAALMWGIPLAMFICGLWQVFGPGTLVFVTTGSGPWSGNTYLGLVTMLWAGGEALAHYSLLRKRLKLGLADPIVANRMFLWGFSIFAAASISASTLVLQALGYNVAGTALGTLLVGPLGLVAASGLALAFWPPKAYLAWVRARENF